jgi:hypothetical protein
LPNDYDHPLSISLAVNFTTSETRKPAA